MQAMRFLLVFCGVGLGACGGGAQDKQAADRQAAGGMAGMHMDSGGMDGHMDMESMRMVPMMRAHLDSLRDMPPARMTQMMGAHDRMMSQMMDRMGGDMRSMNMAGNKGWTALADSVKGDLADLPGLQGKALSARMKAHVERVRRLLAMHEDMMKGM